MQNLIRGLLLLFLLVGLGIGIHACAKKNDAKSQQQTSQKRTFAITVYIPQGGTKEYITDDNNVNWSNGFLVFYRGGKLIAVSGTVTMEER